jgi:hypothetical protein
MIACVYLGYALADGRLCAFQVEYLGIVAFGAVATLALARGSALLPALGYLGHGLWGLPPGGAQPWPADGDAGSDRRVNQAYEQLWQDLQGELVGLSSRGRLVVAHDSGHYIQLERPQLVVDAIAEVVAAARTGSGDPAARASAEKEGQR